MMSKFIKSMRNPARYLLLASAFLLFVFYSLFIIGNGMIEHELSPILSSIVKMTLFLLPLLAIMILFAINKTNIAKIIFIVFSGYLLIDSIIKKLENAGNVLGGSNWVSSVGLILGFLTSLLGITAIVMFALVFLFKKDKLFNLGIKLSLVYIIANFVLGTITVVGYALDMHYWYEIMGELAYSIILPIFLVSGAITMIIPLEEGETQLPPLFQKKALTKFLIIFGIVVGSSYVSLSTIGLSGYGIPPFGINAASERNDPIDSYTDLNVYSGDQSISRLVSIMSYKLKGKGDITYIDFQDGYNAIYSGLVYSSELSVNISANIDSTYTFRSKYGSITIDVYKETIKTKQSAPMLWIDNRNDDDISTRLFDGMENYNSKLLPTSNKVTKPNYNFKISLKKYGIDLLAYKNRVYIPLQTFLDIFMLSNGLPLAFNGKGVFVTSAFANKGMQADHQSLEYYFYNTSPWKDRNKRDSKLATFTYYELCFYLDYFYGLKQHRSIKSFDSYITSLGLKPRLLSTNTKTYDKAFAELIVKYLSEGHTSFRFQSPFSVFENMSDTLEKYKKSNYKVNSLQTKYEKYTTLRKDKGKDIGVSYANKTAVIRFDAFNKMSNTFNVNVESYFYSYQTLHDNDTYLFLLKAFKEIEKKDNIKNVILDITCNGGGAVAVLPYVLGFFNNSPKIAYKNRLTGETTIARFSLDLDKDQTFGNDSYKGKYKLFLLTSGFSFSCANALSTYVKDYNYATIVGEQSGGGACIVSQLATACGSLATCSGNLMFGTVAGTTFINNEYGVAPDYLLDSSYWYDDYKLESFVNRLL